MLGGYSRMAIAILAAAFFAIGASWLAWFDAKSHLEHRIESLKKDHVAAMQAADNAIRARNEIYALQFERALGLEKALGDCKDFADLPIPADLRLQLTEACERNTAANGFAGPDNFAGSQ